MTVTIRTLMNGEAELARIDAEAQAKKDALRSELESATAARRAEIAEIAERVGALTIPDDILGGVLLGAVDRYTRDRDELKPLAADYLVRFPGAAGRSRRRGRPSRPQPQAPGPSATGGEQAGAIVAD
ncbi:putative protein OS=Bosea thiooxidans OX=53254 GN=SAMN05660750_03253 PE=4 SV=1 [Bosea thiooxidans]|uniref:Uncharacterized protein n=2 Tax=Bosea thiooxidans TaxID=53254 RepID=A0A1T5FJ32_9HYPH|nr:hypothetical protein SAMN05660750_03253 [Bosea thiooxidans]